MKQKWTYNLRRNLIRWQKLLNKSTTALAKTNGTTALVVVNYQMKISSKNAYTGHRRYVNLK